ncbi:uncharacterized protein VNE69_01170 [Vairimorpha necatrix]|uniref:Uncharacterized protein n=1 Tax=Vairimorpha necatrix TaxID=6039 RepID=A0AAX4J8H9_9MICR
MVYFETKKILADDEHFDDLDSAILIYEKNIRHYINTNKTVPIKDVLEEIKIPNNKKKYEKETKYNFIYRHIALEKSYIEEALKEIGEMQYAKEHNLCSLKFCIK